MSSGGETETIAPAQAIGRYMVLSRVGAGGLVYAAYDPRLDRRVALKLLRGRGAGEVRVDRERLMREARALARLSHPNVVTVHEVDEHAGRVLIAMEFVEGGTLEGWLEGHPLGVAGRLLRALEVLVQAGRGLEAAHEAGLVHRDFKPANVLVGDDGRVRVVDFGLARGVGEATVEAVDARTDQFSFCVTAWEVLFGVRPVTEGGGLVRPEGVEVPQQVEAVLRKGLSPQAGGRHEGMGALLEVLESASDELRGQVRPARGRAVWRVVGAMALVAALGVGGKFLNDARVEAGCQAEGDVIDAVWNAESREAMRVGLLATEVSYAEDVAEKVMPWVDKSAESWRDASKEACLNAARRGRWDAEQLDRAKWCLEQRRLELATLVSGLGHADDMAVQHAIQSAAGLSPSGVCLDEGVLVGMGAAPALTIRTAVGEVREELANVRYLRDVGNYEEGLALARRVKTDAAALGWAPLEAAVGVEEARLLERTGAYAEAEAVGISAYVLAAKSGTWDQAVYAATGLAFTLEQLDRYNEGLSWAEHARVAIVHAGDPLGLRETKRLLRVGGLRGSLAQHGEAQRLLTRALGQAQRALGSGHPGVAIHLHSAGMQHKSNAEYREATILLKAALQLHVSAFGSSHPGVAVDLAGLGNLHVTLGEYEQARELFERALESETKSLGPSHLHVAYSLMNLGIVANLMGSPHEAKQLMQRALKIMENAPQAMPLTVAETLNNLGAVHEDLHEYAEAKALYERALATKTRVLGADHPNTASTMNNLANTHHSLGDYAEAMTLHERALKTREAALGVEHASVAMYLSNLAVVYNSLKYYEKAVAASARAVQVREKALGRSNHRLAYPLTNLAESLLHLKHHPLAIQHLERAQLLRSSANVSPALVAETDFTLAQALWDAPPPHRDRRRARALALKVRSNYATANDSDSVTEVDAWLAQHRFENPSSP